MATQIALGCGGIFEGGKVEEASRRGKPSRRGGKRSRSQGH